MTSSLQFECSECLSNDVIRCERCRTDIYPHCDEYYTALFDAGILCNWCFMQLKNQIKEPNEES